MQIYGPLALSVCMIIFLGFILFAKSDLATSVPLTKNKLESTIKTSLVDALNTYGHTFYRGWRFIKRCRHFPLIPLTSSFFKGMYYGSLYFLVPMYLLQHPDFLSRGLEIGIYELVSLCFAVFA